MTNHLERRSIAMAAAKELLQIKPILAALMGASLCSVAGGAIAAPGGLTFKQSVEAVAKLPGSEEKYSFVIRYIVEDQTSLLETPDNDPLDYEIQSDLASAFTDEDISFQISGLENDPNVIDQVNPDGETEFEVLDAALNTGFDGTADAVVASGTLDDGQRSVVQYTLTVTYENDAKGPITVTSSMGDQPQSAPLFIPNEVVGQELICPEGTTLSTTNLVTNGSFNTLTNVTEAQVAGAPVAGFSSDYTYSGDFGPLQNGQISIQPGDFGTNSPGIFTQPGLKLQQYPFPGDAVNSVPAATHYLYASGPTGDAGDNGAIWKQTITGLNPGSTYHFFAYASNPRYVGVDGGDPTITLAANSGDAVVGSNKTKTIVKETIGDDWTMVNGTVSPGTTTLDLEIRNENQASTFYNMAVLTGIGVYACLGPGDNEPEPTENPGSDNPSADSGSGGGGGTTGLALFGLTLLGLGRRWIRKS